MDKAILIPLIIWAIFTLVTALKNTISPPARISAVLALAVFAFIFKDDIMALIKMQNIPYMEMIKSSVQYAFISLAIVWPATLFYTQYMSETDSSTVIIRLAIFSAAACVGFLYFG